MSTTHSQSARRYNSIIATIVLIILVVIAATNAIVDPKGKLGLLTIDRLNTSKYFATGSRQEKSSRLLNGSFDTLIAGSSRTQIGLDPDHPALSGKRVYNAALSGTNMEELSGVLRYASRHQNISHLIIGLDFLLFTSNKKTSPDYHDSFFTGSTSWIIPYLLSTSTFKRSTKTIKLNRNGSHRIHSNNAGFIDKTGSPIDHRKRFEEVLRINFLVDPQYYGAYSYSHNNLTLLDNSLSLFLKNSTDIKLFISPIHARHLEAIHAMGLWETYNQWRHDLVFLVKKLQSSYSREIPLWDFSGYNSITTEAVPEARSNVKMQWYWESSHYKKSVGNLILNRISGYNTSSVPADFGVIINSDNLDTVIKNNQLTRQRYLENHPDEVKDVITITRETETIRKQRAHMFENTAL